MSHESMIEGELMSLMKREPFVPLTIALNTGERFAVVDRSRLAYCDGRVVMFPANSTSEYFRLTKIAALEVPEMFA